MDIVFKNFELSNISEALEELSSQNLSSIKTSYRLSKMMKAMVPHLRDFAEARQKLILSYAKKDDNGELMRPEKDGEVDKDSIVLDNPEEYNKKMIDLLNEEITVSFSVKLLSLDDLDASGAKISPQKLLILEKLIEQEEE